MRVAEAAGAGVCGDRSASVRHRLIGLQALAGGVVGWLEMEQYGGVYEEVGVAISLR
ncbi:MAG: hypothetical protein MH252_02945 [Thermosynechococcaceae cyanobacterium MS004]|nr:hypothetical protein [Thermosynechococcaceae cyanobacterium MS004]